MAMNGNTLGDEMFDAVNAIASGATEADARARMRALGNAIVNHVTSNATIAALPGTHGQIVGTSLHVHPLITTIAVTGKIS